jgi:hypothetical protein
MQHLVARGGQRPGQTAPVAARALDAYHRAGGVALGQPADQPPITGGSVGEHQNAAFAAALINQRGGVGVLVHVNADEHPLTS